MGPVPKVAIGAALTGVVAAGGRWMDGSTIGGGSSIAALLTPYLAVFVAFLIGLLIARLIWRDTRRSGR